MYVSLLTNFGIAGDLLPWLALERGSDINMSVSPDWWHRGPRSGRALPAGLVAGAMDAGLSRHARP
jgi:hypothetical protein